MAIFKRQLKNGYKWRAVVSGKCDHANLAGKKHAWPIQ